MRSNMGNEMNISMEGQIAVKIGQGKAEDVCTHVTVSLFTPGHFGTRHEYILTLIKPRIFPPPRMHKYPHADCNYDTAIAYLVSSHFFFQRRHLAQVLFVRETVRLLTPERGESEVGSEVLAWMSITYSRALNIGN